MRAYECVYILDPSLDETGVREKTEKFNEIIKSRKGTVHRVDHWGKRKLAYPINKKFEGIYNLVKFSGDNEILNELNRIFRFDEFVLRHLIVIDEKPVPQESATSTEKTME
ncbi:MAG: 30S ribosomal protein S6 [Candidatus Krumholzibacteria bacterium]|jgi:small subunit ribosomal protein S6|nr:30S ribosomal protein S6 [Candidatus Krumholzibacteria bacterium]